MEATADLGFQDAGYTLQALAAAGLEPYQLPEHIIQAQADAGLEPLRTAMKPRREVTAHVTANRGILTATFQTGAQVIGTLDQVATELRVCAVRQEAVTMPEKGADDAPTMGQRVALYAALKTPWRAS